MRKVFPCSKTHEILVMHAKHILQSSATISGGKIFLRAPVWPKNWFFLREGLLWRAVAPRIIIRKDIWKYYCDPLEQGFHQVYLTKFYFFLNPNWYPGLGLNVRIMENLWSCLIMASLSRLLSWCLGLLAEKIYHWIPDEVERALPFSDRWADEIEHGYRVGSEARSVLKYRS